MKWIALLRAVNLGKRKLTSADLKSVCEERGWKNVRTLLASGNVVFDAAGPAAKLEAALEKAILEKCGYTSEVMVRSPAEWAAILAANPMPKPAKDDPSHFVVMVMKDKPDTAVLDAYLKTYEGPETVKTVGRELFIYYPQGQGRTDLKLPKKIGVGTARNWNTMNKLMEMVS